ncbi:hypothetical protein Tco_0901043 [Tanacetum coccineum]
MLSLNHVMCSAGTSRLPTTNNLFPLPPFANLDITLYPFPSSVAFADQCVNIFPTPSNHLASGAMEKHMYHEKEKLHVDDERMAKEKESVVRVSLENEIFSLKSHVLSLSQKGSLVPESVS